VLISCTHLSGTESLKGITMTDSEVTRDFSRVQPLKTRVNDCTGESIGTVVEYFSEQGLRIRLGRHLAQVTFDIPFDRFMYYVISDDAVVMNQTREEFSRTVPLGVRFTANIGSREEL
jgi:hypothetical protein